MKQENKPNVSPEHESAPMVPDLDFLMAIAFRENDAPHLTNSENIS